ncbi:unnamed protein product [Acanthoscelides obtectus]|nr:unnamed protein product [Acanthoscelides obtectus]CAK1622659.1 Cytochrome P450 4d2 [Acanthoscelides obtectus]
MALVITDPKFMEYILSSTKIISKAFQYDFFHEWLGTGLLTSTGIKWRKRRKMLTPSFHFSILENFMDVFEKVGDIFIERLWEEVGKPSVDIYPLVSLCTLDIICEASMGISINAINDGDSEYVRSVKQMCQIPVDRTFDFTAPFQPWIHPITPNYFKQKRAIKVLHEHTDRVIDERIKNPINISDEDKDSVGMKKRLAFLDLLLTATIDGKPLSRMDIREEVDTFMFEGHDTTSAAIAFAMFSLAENRGIQQKVLEEQISIFGEKKNRKTTTTDLQDMKYLELVIKETLRLYPSVPWVGRKFPEDIEWEGTLYPKDMNLMLYIFGTQRDARYFPEPLKFRPERFLDTEIPNPFAYVPFSAGPRNCIGQRFAMMEMKSTISKIVRNFELLPATPKHELQLAPEVILVSKNGIRISLNRRK